MVVAKLVFPEDSGPNISIMRPLGTPPPKARSSEMMPVGIISTLETLSAPILIIAPLPNCFSIDCKAILKASFRPSPSLITLSILRNYK
ncbi:MAG: hypothetical protein ACD_83C00205G0001 [uncultured bacterium]|nr:MAG: hypothetical protein ACD_83C00205G0001 [uncultured bacterium]